MIKTNNESFLEILFKLINTTAKFQNIINNILYNFYNIFKTIFFDNILIFLKIKEKHLDFIKLVIKYFEKN